MTHTISIQQARNYLYHYHGFSRVKQQSVEQAIITVFQRLQAVQYDPLNVVGRNPDLVLQSRIEGYHPSALYNLLYDSRTLIDDWDKMMCIYLADDWPKLQRVQTRKAQGYHTMLKKRQQLEAFDVTDRVYHHVEINGPSVSRDIDLGSTSKGVWGHSRLSGVALDYLYSAGKLAVAYKQGTHKVYDLHSRLFPNHDGKAAFTNQADFMDWYVKRRIASVGLVRTRNSGAWLGYFIEDNKARQASIKRLLAKGELTTVQIDGIDEPFYAPVLESFSDYINTPIRNKKVRFIAPLDNLIWDRSMLKLLYNFDYTWEVYVPKVKRKFGYYVLPIMYGNHFVGRVEFENYRTGQPLVVKQLWWQEGTRLSKSLINAYNRELKLFAKYLGATQIEGEING